ncbi:hypothetical protein BYT27DRAFT_7110517, partial [Phlegmacium glaucopus]
YLFTHRDMSRQKPQDFDIYWKEMVAEIKTLPSQPDALVKVRWFWSKEDIQQLIKPLKVDKKLTQILGAASSNELFPGEELVINSSDAIECNVDIVHLTESVNQEPVVDYFFRLAWDESLQTMHGHSPFGCGRVKCHQLWDPEKEEQRYCYHCQKWYHSSCLAIYKLYTQTKTAQRSAKEMGLKQGEVPQILLDAAFQPTARGGMRHFIAGNIRIVTKARELVENEDEREGFAEGMAWSNDEWASSLESYFGILEENRENFQEEQLVVSGQDIYHCAGCNKFI